MDLATQCLDHHHPMKLLLIHQPFATPKDGGGTRHFEFSIRFVQDGNEFEVITSDRGYLTGQQRDREVFRKYSTDYPGLVIVPAFTYRSLHAGKLGRVISLLSFMISSFLKALFAKNVDVVMGTSPPIFQAASAWLVSVLKRKPFLLEIRDLWPEFLVDMGLLKNRLLISLFKWLELFLYRRSDHILVNSPAYRDYLIGQNVPETKISIIPNGVDPLMFKPDDSGIAFRNKHNLNGSFLAVYAGALGPSNDIENIIGAASLLQDHDDINIVLIGAGIGKDSLENLANQKKLTNVRFVGSLPKCEMPEALAAAEVCLATLRNIRMFKTTYPNKVFDYMAAGRPTILGIDGVIRQVIEDAGAGIFVTPGDSDQLSEAILAMYYNRQECVDMGARARDYVVRNFNRDDQAIAFNQLVQRLAKS